MAWKNFVSPIAIRPRRKVVATAFVYGLSLAVRFTSAAGEEIEIPAYAARGTNPMTSIMINDGAQIFYKDWPPRSAQPIALHRGWPLASRGCRSACEGPMQSCPAP
jgi:hypothetical protein